MFLIGGRLLQPETREVNNVSHNGPLRPGPRFNEVETTAEGFKI
jgi:hypothetical protein